MHTLPLFFELLQLSCIDVLLLLLRVRHAECLAGWRGCIDGSTRAMCIIWLHGQLERSFFMGHSWQLTTASSNHFHLL